MQANEVEFASSLTHTSHKERGMEELGLLGPDAGPEGQGRKEWLFAHCPGLIPPLGYWKREESLAVRHPDVLCCSY